MKVELGDILLVRNYGFLGWLIRSATKSNYNHCCIYVGSDILVDTDFFGIRYRRLSAYDNIPHKVIRVKDLTRKQKVQVCKHARKLTGKRYSVLSLFRFKNKIGESYNCSQMVNSIYAKFGIVLCDKFIKVTPADIERSKLTVTIQKEILKDKRSIRYADREL